MPKPDNNQNQGTNSTNDNTTSTNQSGDDKRQEDVAWRIITRNT